MAIPNFWYNISTDLPRPLPPPIDPIDEEGSRISLLNKILPSELIHQEFSGERFISIPERIRDFYRRIGRPTPLRRAYGFEKAIGAKVKIYYKFEGALPSGSHKLNTALPQVYYAIKDGTKEVVTETGAGQWGLAVAIAASLLKINARIFMTRSSYLSKKGRVTFMKLFGAKVHPSPSKLTEIGKEMLKVNPKSPGSLGISIAEAVEYVLSHDRKKYLPGSVMEFVLIHQTIIGQEAIQQLEEEPDLIIGCVGGGSNFAGLAYPFLGMKFRNEGFEKTQFLAVESSSVPKLTNGIYRYDFPDSKGILPMVKMLTLGYKYVPPPLHAAGLRYHGAAPSLSLLIKHNYIKVKKYDQEEVMKAAQLFAKTEGIIPAPEPAHAIRAILDEVNKLPSGSVILFNLSGHGFLDVDAYRKVLKI